VAEYGGSKPVKVTGVVTKVEWTNPHIWFYVDVKGDAGKVNNWGFSAGSRSSRPWLKTRRWQMSIDNPRIFTAAWIELGNEAARRIIAARAGIAKRNEKALRGR
jgi:hypothetical protein